MYGKEWLQQDRDLIRDLYRSLTTKQISRRLNLTEKSIQWQLYAMGEKKEINFSNNPWMQKQVNHDFFKVWTKEMSYILGYICADGNIYNGCLSFTSIDLDLLEIIRNILESKSIIKFHRDTYRLRIYSKTIIEDLEKFGVKANKTFDLEYPEIPLEFEQHFVRGFLDGDGSIYIHKVKRTSFPYLLTTGFVCASKNFLRTLQDHLIKLINLKKKKLSKLKNCYRIEFSKRESLKLLSYIYYDSCNCRLERKFQIYQKYIGDLEGKIKTCVV